MAPPSAFSTPDVAAALPLWQASAAHAMAAGRLMTGQAAAPRSRPARQRRPSGGQTR